jgi:hypothetical protein
MKYKEIYNSIDEYLKKTSLQDYCRTVCKGDCCKDCSLFPRGCINKLICKMFLCKEIREFLNNFFNTKDFDFFFVTNTEKLLQPLIKSMNLENQKDIYLGEYNLDNLLEYDFPEIHFLPLNEERVEDTKKLFEFFTRVKIDRKSINSFDKKLLMFWAKIR